MVTVPRDRTLAASTLPFSSPVFDSPVSSISLWMSLSPSFPGLEVVDAAFPFLSVLDDADDFDVEDDDDLLLLSLIER